MSIPTYICSVSELMERLSGKKMAFRSALRGGHQDKPFIVQTEQDRFFVAWLDYREDFGEESIDAIYGQQIDLSGALLWEENGVAISTSDGEHYPPFVVTVGEKQWVVVWSNTQRDNGDIYLERF